MLSHPCPLPSAASPLLLSLAHSCFPSLFFPSSPSFSFSRLLPAQALPSFTELSGLLQPSCCPKDASNLDKFDCSISHLSWPCIRKMQMHQGKLWLFLRRAILLSNPRLLCLSLGKLKCKLETGREGREISICTVSLFFPRVLDKNFW